MLRRSKTQVHNNRAAFQDRADAYNTFVLVGTLLTGFGITFLFEYDETLFINKPVLLSLFMISLSLVIVTSGLGSIIMALEFYGIKKLLAVQADQRLRTFEKMSGKYKNVGRRSVYLSFVFLYFALGLYIYVKASDDAYIGTIISMIIFFIAIILIIFVAYKIKAMQKELRANPTKYGDSLQVERAGTTDLEMEMQQELKSGDTKTNENEQETNA